MFHKLPEDVKPNNAHLPVDSEHPYITPTKLIKTPTDMQTWEKSEAYYEYVGFLLALNEAVKGKPNSLPGIQVSSTIESLVEVLNQLDNMIDEIPPVQQPQRFGNQAFKTWLQKLNDNVFALLHSVVPTKLHRAIPEILIYFMEGFGNGTRIDYGTGHEMAFIMFLCCLFKIGLCVEADKAPIVCKVFTRYLEVVRKLQQTYRMEPAGSHGVWSLDDYQFVPFIWGSAQLIGHPVIEPTSFLNNRIVEKYSKDYMFLSCIEYINRVKTGPFAEHSNQLWSISGVSGWSKINSGLIKMYKAEVLNKFPVVQHIYFGSLLSLKSVEPNATLPRPPLIDPLEK